MVRLIFNHMLRISLSIFLLAATLFAAACSTTNDSFRSETSIEPMLDIRKGSSTEDLVAALGEPLRTAPFDRDPENVTVWYYKIEKSITEMIAARTVDVPYVDPITNVEKIVKEPVYLPQTRTTITHLEVFIADNLVVAWKVKKEADSELAE